MKKFLFATLLFFCFSQAFAAHIKGGFFTYQYLGPGIANPTFLRYKITLTVYMICNPTSGQLNNPINFTVFQGNTATMVDNPSVSITSQYNLNKLADEPCIAGDQSGCYYTIVIYELDNYELPVSLNGYTISYQRCCRINAMDNVTNSGNVGNTWSILIPGTNSPIPNANHNNSPLFPINDTIVVCENSFFSYPFSATDLDGDSLVYSLCNAFEGGDPGNVSPNPASPPPYNTVPYAFPFSGAQPLGAGVTINPVTGLISGIAPSILNTGEYVITVCIREYRNGVYFADSRKELHIRVKDCLPLVAGSNFVPVTCDGFTVDFTNSSSGSPTIFSWDFGDPASGAANTSNLPNPTHTFTAAGIFNVKLVVSMAGGLCADSVTKPISVFPGFFPGFTAAAPLCAGKPVQFTDTSLTLYGFVDSWRWDFGDLTTLADTSHLQSPVYTYAAGGVYNVELRVTNSKGCNKTIIIPVVINDNPLLSVFPPDSVYCGLDSLQLTGTGTGTFIWTPPISIIGANTATPIVFPVAPIKYYAKLTSPAGCASIDSLNVTPKFDLSNAIAGPITICEEDTVTLTGSSNYINNLTWSWTPVATVESPGNSTTRVYPIVNTTYTLNTRWGNHCVATKTHTINVTPLAIPNAGPDAFVCGGQSFTQLNATGGTTYQWTPVTGLSNPNIPNPIATPTVPTFYVVAVGVPGCPKLRTDTVFVDVGAPPPFTTLNDTLICNIDTLQLTTTGTGTYNWSPNYMISSTTAQSPLVSPDVPTRYHVRLTDAVGCYSDDSVFVDVKDKVTLNAGSDTTICQSDGFLLSTTGDALHYIWTPNTYLDFDNIRNPFTRPLTSITYHVIGNIGKCQADDYININVVPYPVANAGPDISTCPGFSVQLNATGGSSYYWSPITFLNNRNIPNPVSVNPTASIRYIVAVSDILGCPKLVKDTVWVTVYPRSFADAGPGDTTVVEGEPLYLHATGGATYLWTPSTWLNDPTVSSPVSLPHDNIKYTVQVTTINGCIATDTILVLLYKVDPDMYVPTAFTPNGDGNNDVLRPILLGMKELTYFKVFNRFGQMVFSTSEKGKGWDGNYGGKPQDPATFVWMAEGVTYKGQVKKKKGYAVLIR